MKARIKILIAAIYATLLLGACTTMQVEPALLSNADIMEVKGRQGWLINQKLQFGEYKSGKVKRG